MSKKVSAFALVALLSAVGLYAGVPETNWENRGQVNGWVVSNHVFSGGDGFLTVHVPSAGNTVRLDYLASDNSGAETLLPYRWVFVRYYLDAEVGCLDGPNTMVRPLIIEMWSDACLCTLIWDHDLSAWISKE